MQGGIRADLKTGQQTILFPVLSDQCDTDSFSIGGTANADLVSIDSDLPGGFQATDNGVNRFTPTGTNKASNAEKSPFRSASVGTVPVWPAVVAGEV